MNKSVMKCCICNNENIGQFITINNKKYHLCCIEQLQQESQQLKEKLLVAQTNEETFRLEMEDITLILGLDEDTIFDDVKVYARNLKDNWNKLKEYIMNDINNRNGSKVVEFEDGRKVSETISPNYILMENKSRTMREVLDTMQEIERRNINDCR